MKNYIYLKEGDILAIGDEQKFFDEFTEDWVGYQPSTIGGAESVTARGEHLCRYRRPVPHTGDVQFLMCMSPIVPIVVNCDGKTQEEIENEAGRLLVEKILANPHKYILFDNIEWGECKVDDIQPEPKSPGKYRMLEMGDIIQSGDEYLFPEGWQLIPSIMIGDEFNADCDAQSVRRPITEPQYRTLEVGETIMAGDEMKNREETQWFKCNATVGCTVDEDEPYEYRRPITEPEIPGKYRMLGDGEVFQEGDEVRLVNKDEEWRKMHISPSIAGTKAINGFAWEYRRPITEPQYRPFKEGDVIEEGDQFSFDGKWYDFCELCYGEEINPQHVPIPRKLIK